MSRTAPITAFDVVSHLSQAIGVRRAGTEEERQAALYIGDLARSIGARVSVEPFSFRDSGNDRSEIEMHVEGASAPVECALLPYSVPSAPTVLKGTLRYDGKWAIIPQRTACERYLLLDGAGEVAAWVLVDPYGGLRSLPNFNPLSSTPMLVVGQDMVQVIRDAAAARSGVRVSLPRTTEQTRFSQNLVAEVGTGEKLLLVVAHMDSVPGSPGGNDNASGVAVALELCRWYQANPHPGITMRLLFSGAEEPFLAGSRIYASRAIPSDGIDRFVGCLNLDMVGIGDAFVVKAEPGSAWETAGLDAEVSVTEIPVKIEPLMPSSDHWAFHEAGVSSAQLTRGADPHWHQKTDTGARVTPEALEAAVAVAQALITSYISGVARERNDIGRDTDAG
jgi:aminopeptidase YwaD